MHRKYFPVVLSLVALMAVGTYVNADVSATSPTDVNVEKPAVTPAVPQPTTDDECVVKEGQPLPEHCVKKDDAVKTESHEELAQVVTDTLPSDVEVQDEQSGDVKSTDVTAPVDTEKAPVVPQTDEDVEYPVDQEVVPDAAPYEDASVPEPRGQDEALDVDAQYFNQQGFEEQAVPIVPEPESDSVAPESEGVAPAVQPYDEGDVGPECPAPSEDQALAMNEDSSTSTMMSDKGTIEENTFEAETTTPSEVAPSTPVVPEPQLPVCKEVGEENCIPAGEVVPSAPKAPETPLDDSAVHQDSELAQATVTDQPAVREVTPAEATPPAAMENPSVPAEAAPAQPQADNQPAKESGEFHDRLKKFSVKFPDTWELRRGMAGMDVVGISPLEGPDDKFRENVNIASQIVDQPIDMKTFFDEGQKALSEQLPGFKLIGTGDMNVSGLPVKWIEFNQSSGNIEATVKQYYIIADGGKKAYIITGAAPPDKFDTFKPVIDKIVGSFKVEQ